jgi:hypothetical protein
MATCLSTVRSRMMHKRLMSNVVTSRLQRPFVFIFACLIAQRDLVYVVYEQPALAMCRTKSQLPKALNQLNIPSSYAAAVQAMINTRQRTLPLAMNTLMAMARLIAPAPPVAEAALVAASPTDVDLPMEPIPEDVNNLVVDTDAEDLAFLTGPPDSLDLDLLGIHSGQPAPAAVDLRTRLRGSAQAVAASGPSQVVDVSTGTAGLPAGSAEPSASEHTPTAHRSLPNDRVLLADSLCAFDLVHRSVCDVEIGLGDSSAGPCAGSGCDDDLHSGSMLTLSSSEGTCRLGSGRHAHG